MDKKRKRSIGTELFPDDKEWLNGIYKKPESMFKSFEFFVKYINRRFPKKFNPLIEDVRASFLVEDVEIEFCDPLKYPNLSISSPWAKSKFIIRIPLSLPKHEREALRDRYLMKYPLIIKESHVRMMGLFWKLLGGENRPSDEILEDLEKALEEIKTISFFKIESEAIHATLHTKNYFNCRRR